MYSHQNKQPEKLPSTAFNCIAQSRGTTVLFTIYLKSHPTLCEIRAVALAKAQFLAFASNDPWDQTNLWLQIHQV